ncbi:MAG: BACON domain-containing protein [Tannerellaceae bacterium]|nr:BACON domain-containing protein [Tannerellaceae bacterium]
MKEYIKIAVFLIGVMIAVSCVDNDPDSCKGGSVVDENGEMTREFILQLPSPVKNVSTYASMTEEDENRIDDLVLLAFKIEGSNETFAYQAKATAIEDIGSGSDTKKVTVKLKVSDDYYRFVFLANVTSEIEEQLGDIASVGEKDLVLQRLTQTCEEEKQWDDTDCFPMWGESEPWQIKEDGNTDKNVKMIRAVSRIDVVSTTNNFKVVGAHLYQFHRKGYVVPHPDNINSDKTSHTATIPAEPLMVGKSLPYSAENDEIVQTIYTYESYKNSVHLEKTCLVVGGIYYPADYKDGDPEPAVSWYRIDFVDTEEKDIHLLRNHCYILRIRSVAGEGYTDPDEAYEAKPFNIIVDILEWDQGDIRDIEFNGQYFLGVSESEIYMPKPADSTSVIITTDYPGEWIETYESTDIEGKAWLTPHPETGHFTGIKQKDRLIFNLTENNDGAMRTGKIHLRAGVLRHTTHVYQDIDDDPGEVVWLDDKGEANCYILSPSGNGIRIPVSQANKDGVERIGDNDVVVAEVLWTDTPYPVGNSECVIRSVDISGTGKNALLEVVANKVWGNAVVAVKVNNKIRWSWHIWVLEYQPEETAINYNKGGYDITIMDRNLGALSTGTKDPKSLGLTYQWGRKDPFPGLAGFNTSEGFPIYDKNGVLTQITFTSVSSNNMLENSIEEPMIYIRGGGTYNDWIGTQWGDLRDDLWQKTGNDVSPYDPCPAGWTMDIERNFWDSMNYDFDFTMESGDYGYTYQLGYWPSAGYRETTGEFNTSEVGTVGYYWIGQTNGGDANAIKIGPGAASKIQIGNPTSRSKGMSIRCILDK